MINEQLRIWFVVPVLKGLNAWSQEAEELIVGTFAQESGCGLYVKQLTGPALGYWQMEPKTHDDIHRNVLMHNPKLADALINKVCKLCARPTADLMLDNIRYACGMARIHYMRSAEPIPKRLADQADYWKEHYNTPQGKGTTDEYIANYLKYTGKSSEKPTTKSNDKTNNKQAK